MKPKSNTLFHFTDSITALKAILKDGFWPRYSLEDMAWFNQEQTDYIAFPMVCFCDIPLSRIEEHVQFYGRFGLGLTRQWAEKHGLNPILYLTGANALVEEICALGIDTNELPEETQSKAKKKFRYLLAHMKPAKGLMIVNDDTVEKSFYQESEWRYVPQHENVIPYLRRSQYEEADFLKSANSGTKKHALLKFEPSDVRYIFVEKDSDIPPIMNFIHAELDGQASAIKILSSRILSLESLHSDL